MKWDGYRLAVHVDAKGVRLITRGGDDWTTRFPKIVEAAEKLGVGTAILDGEAVVLDDQGMSDFSALQRSLGGRGGKRAFSEAVLFAFDLLYFDGHDLTGTELSVADICWKTCSRGKLEQSSFRRKFTVMATTFSTTPVHSAWKGSLRSTVTNRTPPGGTATG